MCRHTLLAVSGVQLRRIASAAVFGGEEGEDVPIGENLRPYSVNSTAQRHHSRRRLWSIFPFCLQHLHAVELVFRFANHSAGANGRATRSSQTSSFSQYHRRTDAISKPQMPKCGKELRFEVELTARAVWLWSICRELRDPWVWLDRQIAHRLK